MFVVARGGLNIFCPTKAIPPSLRVLLPQERQELRIRTNLTFLGTIWERLPLGVPGLDCASE